MMRGIRRPAWASSGAFATAVLSSLCCVGPLIYVAFGVGAGLASTFEPLRPVFSIATAGLLGLAFYAVYGKPRDAEVGSTCPVPRSRKRDKVIVWSAAIFVIVAWSFPYWSVLLL